MGRGRWFGAVRQHASCANKERAAAPQDAGTVSVVPGMSKEEKERFANAKISCVCNDLNAKSRNCVRVNRRVIPPSRK